VFDDPAEKSHNVSSIVICRTFLKIV
jgi:hypothetical protein